MSSIFLDGMYYPTADILFKYSAINGPVISTVETSRVGPGSMNIKRLSSSFGGFTYSTPIDLKGATLGFRFKNQSTMTTSDYFTLGGTFIQVFFSPNYSLRVLYPGGEFTTDPAQHQLDVWTYIEFQYTQGSGDATVTLRINDSIPTTGGGTGSATASGLTITADATNLLWHMGSGSNAVGCFIQDLYIFDGLGSKNNDFIGDSRVDIQRPDAPGTYTDFTPSAGANWQNVDEYACDLDTTYNASSVIGDQDSYSLSDISLTGGEIFAVQQQSIVRKDDASIRYGKQLLISGSTEDLGDEKQFSDDYVGYQRTFDVDPDTGITWTESGVNSLESGLEITA